VYWSTPQATSSNQTQPATTYPKSCRKTPKHSKQYGKTRSPKNNKPNLSFTSFYFSPSNKSPQHIHNLQIQEQHARCWVYRKRAFSISGSFRKALTDLITQLHNSNKPLVQVNLLGEIIPEEQFHLLGIVAGKDLHIEQNIWFTILNAEQLNLLTDCLKEKSSF
jgi:hypothetical protein